MQLQEVKQYIRVDYDDDDELIQMLIEAVMEEMAELIPKFDKEALTARQKVLICAYAKEMYDQRDRSAAGSAENIRYTIHSLMLKEMLR